LLQVRIYLSRDSKVLSDDAGNNTVAKAITVR
jgi:hypothetical protein